jgi:hypothetical protein
MYRVRHAHSRGIQHQLPARLGQDQATTSAVVPRDGLEQELGVLEGASLEGLVASKLRASCT